MIEPVAPIRISVNHFIPYVRLTTDRTLLAALRADRLITEARRLSVRTYRELLDVWDGPQAVAAVHQPLLVLQGRHDRMQPVQQSELIFAAANQPKRFELLDTGHLPHLDAPHTLVELIRSWLTTISRVAL